MARKLQSGRSRAWRHKWVFALVEADFVATAFWLGASPESFYIYYTAQMAVVMCGKIFDYRITEQHYFLLDFCFFANACTLAWLWIWPASGLLFNAVEAFCGVLALSVLLFRNSCVPHDFARISNAYVHYPQVLLVLSSKWRCTGERCMGISTGISEPCSIRVFQAWSVYMSWAVILRLSCPLIIFNPCNVLYDNICDYIWDLSRSTRSTRKKARWLLPEKTKFPYFNVLKVRKLQQVLKPSREQNERKRALEPRRHISHIESSKTSLPCTFSSFRIFSVSHTSCRLRALEFSGS